MLFRCPSGRRVRPGRCLRSWPRVAFHAASGFLAKSSVLVGVKVPAGTGPAAFSFLTVLVFLSEKLSRRTVRGAGLVWGWLSCVWQREGLGVTESRIFPAMFGGGVPQ